MVVARRPKAFLPWSQLPAGGRLVSDPVGTWNRRIYALVCPDSDRIMYVGQTGQTLEARLAGHVAKPTNAAMAAWIRALHSECKEPQIRLISLAPDQHWQDCERNWIAYVQARASLLNVDPGGICRDSSGKPIPKRMRRAKMFASQASYEARTGKQWTGSYDGPQKAKKAKGPVDPWAKHRDSEAERLARISQKQMERARTT